MLTPELGRVMVVDDEPELLKALCKILREQGYETVGFAAGREALEALEQQDFDLLLTDLMMPGMDGIALLRAALEIDRHLVGVIMTGQGTIQTAVEAMKLGAFDYVLKPFKMRELLPVLSRAMGVRRLRLENMELRQTVAIYDLTAMAAFTLDLNLILDKTAEAALQQCQADEVSILLPTPAGNEFYVAAVRGAQRAHILGERAPMDQGIASWVARHREPLVLHGQVDDPRFAPVNPRADICTAISLPMVVGGKLVGVLNVNATRPRRPFTPGELKALRLLTSIAASALESARLYAQVKAAQEYSRNIIGSSLDMIIAVDMERRIIEFNSAAQETFGYRREEVLGKHIDLLYADPEESAEVHNTISISGKCVQEVRNRRKNGGVFPSFLAASVLCDVQGEAVGFMGISRDITERKKTEEALQLFRTLIDRSNDIIEVVDPETGRLFDVNEKGCLDLGYSREELLALSIFDIDPTVDPSSFTRAAEELRKSGSLLWEGLHRRKDDSTFPIEVNISYIDLDREYALAVVRDITARKRQELEEQAVQQVREQVWELRSAGDIDAVLTVMKDSLKAMGVPFHRCGTNVVDDPGDPPAVRSHTLDKEGQWIPPKSQEGKDLIVRFWRKGVSAYRRDLHQEDLYGERKRLEGHFGAPVRSVLDIPFSHGTLAVNSTEPDAFSAQDVAFLEKLAGVLSEGFHRLDDLKTIELTQAQLYQAQKVEILGQVAGGVAHDFNNLLAIISGYTETLLRKRELDATQRELLTEVQQAGERGQGLVRQLLVFSRKQKVQVGEVDLNQVVRGMERMMGRLIGKGIELRVDLTPELGRIKADVGQMEQVLMNLVVNARDAMPQGGSLVVETANAGREGGQSQVVLAVRDTGIGMEEEVQQRIFEPFFTTKEEGKGTGLGLAVVQRIVGQAGGHIAVHSRPGQGTRFEVYWPCLEEGRRTILVVDDEEKVVQIVALMLQGQGYEVLAATGGEEALERCGQHSGKIDLLLADVEMEGRKGWEVAAQVKGLYPGVQVVYISGYQHHPEVERQVREGKAGFLAKPFSAESLLPKVREVLNATVDTR
ncbi:MAG: response regulator [Candidatus Latescibacteria bacterium]|nr:response regulator [Candidatus Latescibacterota bacterium]